MASIWFIRSPLLVPGLVCTVTSADMSWLNRAIWRGPTMYDRVATELSGTIWPWSFWM